MLNQFHYIKQHKAQTHDFEMKCIPYYIPKTSKALEARYI